MNDLQILLNEKANSKNQINPFLNDYVTSNQKRVTSEKRKKDVSSRPHPLLFIFGFHFTILPAT